MELDTSAPPSDAASNRDNDDLEPASFLKSIRELSERREQEDLERYRKLEEDVERSRAERAKKRALGGATSNVYGASSAGHSHQQRFAGRTPSPTKSHSMSEVPLLRTDRTDDTGLSSPPPLTRSATSFTPDMEGSRAGPPSPTKDIPEFKGFSSVRRGDAASPSLRAQPSDTASRPSPSASSLARSGTLTWQQRRPGSRGGSRPASVVASENTTHVRPSSAEQAELSRDQIAASLGSREPSYFRQTADRGVGSAAYRKSKDESPAEQSIAAGGRRGLPGLSRPTSFEPARKASPAPSESLSSETISLPVSARDSGFASSRVSATPSMATPSKPDLKSLLAEDESQREASPMSDHTSSTGGEQNGLSRTLSMSSSQARLAGANERPSSPTKGMGGFVQSAMMKRSDSVSKRWSAQPGANLSRHNSTVSARSGYNGLQGSHSMPRLEPTPSSREASDEPASRPTSSSSNLTALAQQGDTEEVFVKPALPYHSRSKSVASAYGTTAEDEAATSPPSSPSKRFSPTKSSWIESALTRPESPKPSSGSARNAQPSWMANIAKAKAERASAESTPRTGTPKPVEETSRPASPTKTTPFGPALLKRSESRDLPLTPRSSTPPNAPKTPTVVPKEVAAAEQAPAPVRNLPVAKEAPEPISEPKDLQADATAESTRPAPKDEEPRTASFRSPMAPSAAKPKLDPPTSTSAPSPLPSPLLKPKPDPPAKPQTDFRSTLRSRPAGEGKAQGTPEFLSKFGQLRKTQQEKYVAPDILKGNITRGKSELAKTGGPVKTLRRDELKESLLAKKDDWKKAKEEGRELPGQVHERKTSATIPVTPPKPEALAKREVLARQDVVKTAVGSERGREATPEALARQRSLKDSPVKMATPLKHAKPVLEAPKFETLSKQQSAPAVVEHPQASETSRLAARFNPGLAGILARGPPSTSNSNAPSRSESPVLPMRSATLPADTPSEQAPEGPLQDMRKGRAKGPKKRKGGAAEPASEETVAEAEPAPMVSETKPQLDDEPALFVPSFRARAPPGSAASLMMASLKKSTLPQQPVADMGLPDATPTLPDPKNEDEPVLSVPSFKPRAPAGSAASLMTASLRGAQLPQPSEQASSRPATPAQPLMPKPAEQASSKPATPAKSFDSFVRPEPRGTPAKPSSLSSKPSEMPGPASKSDTPDFGGFRSTYRAAPTPKVEDDKENSSETLPSVKSAASFWGRQPSPKKADAPPQIHLPSRRDEEAAMRSAGLLASSHSRPGSSSSSSNGLGITVDKRTGSLATPPGSAGLPPRPSRSSRTVSGQLLDSSPNREDLLTHAFQSPESAEANRCQGALRLTLSPSRQPSSGAGRLLMRAFGTVPTSDAPLAIDVRAVISEAHKQPAEDFKTLRRSMSEVLPDGAVKTLLQQEEYTVFEESVYICSHAYLDEGDVKRTQAYIWSGTSASQSAIEHAQTASKKLSYDSGSLPVSTITQGHETTAFLQALGGILITRRGSRTGAPKQYMLCGRKHLGHITFDEIDFSPQSLCSGYVYLISFPVTLQQTRLYLWKGSACTTEELSAARLAAMDLSETGEIIEVDDGAEFASYLKIFGPGTTKASLSRSGTDFWQQKGIAGDRFALRLYRVQEAEQKVGLFAYMLSRRPSWNGRPPAPSRSPSRDGQEVKVEVKHISPFVPADLEAEGIYVLDAYSELFVLIGPLLGSLMETSRTTLLAQSLLFAKQYIRVCEEDGARSGSMTARVVFGGVPPDASRLFRCWDEGRGLWGTAGLMAGSRGLDGNEVMMAGLDEVMREVCRT
ncbi:hypothetical protein LTR53_008169 [Teratosphaeriaceae sp. CCFEE 6253]|nr:hypothetical protein LTR53_008169 [Teratosphaeriaceae sp. CCFEE 6253]